MLGRVMESCGVTSRRHNPSIFFCPSHPLNCMHSLLPQEPGASGLCALCACINEEVNVHPHPMSEHASGIWSFLSSLLLEGSGDFKTVSSCLNGCVTCTHQTFCVVVLVGNAIPHCLVILPPVTAQAIPVVVTTTHSHHSGL